MKAHRLFTALFALLALTARIHATTFAPTDFVDLVSESAAIAHARVVATRTDWADGRRHIDTFVLLSVVQYFKGDLGRRVEIRIPGGELGRYRDIFIGAPHLAIGDEVILCLSTRRGGAPHVLGLTLGVFRVRHDAGQTFVSPAPAYALDGDPRRIVRGSKAQAPVTLAGFASQVNEVMAAPRDRRRR